MNNAFANYNLPARKDRERIFEIDFLRGFDVFLMIVCHFAYDMGPGIRDFFHFPASYPEWVKAMDRFGNSVFFAITQPGGTRWGMDSAVTSLFPLEVIGAGLFVLLCGISCSFAKSNFERGIKLYYVAMIITLFLYAYGFFSKHAVMGVSPAIILGILHAMAFALILYAIFDHFFNKWWQTFIAAIVLSAGALYGVWYFGQSMNEWDYSLGDFWKLLVGMVRTGDDYFSPLLISAVLFLGASIGKTLYRAKRSYLPKWFPKKWAKPFIFLGKHSLEVYILHQVVLYLILAVMLYPIGFRFAT